VKRALLLCLSACVTPVAKPTPRPAAIAPLRPRSSASASASASRVESFERAEPSVSEVVTWALAAARGISPDRVRDLAHRARMTGLVPQLRLSAERGLQQDLSSSTSSTLDKTNTALGDDFSFSASLTFELDRLVFAPDEVRLLSVERWLAGDQRKLVAEVVKLYFQRRRLLRERALTSAPDSELDDSIAELEAQLDGVTAGAFTSSAQPRSRARP
jgi:hypothetical protein